MVGDPGDAQTDPAPIGPVTAGPTPGRPTGVLPAAVILVLALVGSLVAGVWFGIRAVQAFGDERGMANAVDAAKVVATKLTTFDAGTAEADTKAMLSSATPVYAGALEGDQDPVIKGMRQAQARSNGTVTGAGVLSYNPGTHTAHVLVTVRARVSNKMLPGGQDRDYRMDLTMVEQGDWLVDNVEFVG
jgi:Mce-associated membrane protein